MTDSPDYTAPPSSAIKTRQNTPDALRLLITQRRLYRRAKRWLGLRWLGMFVIGVGAPLVSVLWPSLAVAAGAVAGIWIFLARTVLLARQTNLTGQAAAVQEQFDTLVFDMPEVARRPSLPALEEIASIAGPDEELQKVAEKEKLIDWYPIDDGVDGTVAIAIAQRANASYTNRLLRTTAAVWATAVALWGLALVAIGLVVDLTAAQFLLGIIFPLLPAFLDLAQYVTSVRRSATDKAALASNIEDRLSGRGDPVLPEDLLVWQSQLFDLRRSAPEVPDLIYKVTRPKNERAMHTAARQLSDKTKRSDT
jgi:hypothetical protein